MKKEQDYGRDLAEIRSMMERSSRFMSLSGLAGIMAGIYALAGAFIAYKIFYFSPDDILAERSPGRLPTGMAGVIVLALVVLILAIGTAIFLSARKANKRGEKAWNPSSRRLLTHMAVPLVAGGTFILILILKGLLGLIMPASLIFYGLALYNASKFTYEDVKFLGIIQIILGLLSSLLVEYGLLLWAFGFGAVHIAYGIYMHFRYER